MDICRLESFDFMKLLSSESEMLVWKSQGLPSDSLSMQNAIVLMKSSEQCPFIIDPATAATKWLEDTLAKVRTFPSATAVLLCFAFEGDWLCDFDVSVCVSLYARAVRTNQARWRL
jgi:hypothetical protein